MDLIKAGEGVLVLSESQNFNTSSCASTNITVQTTEEFLQSNVQTVDAIVFDGKTVRPTSELVAKAAGLAKPDAVIIIQDLHPDLVANTEFLVRTNGLVNPEIIQSEKGQMTAVVRKPKYDVGSTTKLNLSRKPAAPVWKLDDDDDDETIDPDELLDEEDYAKPDPTSLRVCGTTGKRKACKDCSCGLAEELDSEAALKRGDGPKSSCGSCYLGDAFRCAACPYKGMPAFKPGEKIQLDAVQMSPDL